MQRSISCSAATYVLAAVLMPPIRTASNGVHERGCTPWSFSSPLWAGFDGQILVGPLALLQVAHQLLPEDHTDLFYLQVSLLK